MDKLRISAAIILGTLFFISTFKHISYPLMWNDEAETAAFGQSILNHGYPKIHDGKNVIYPLLHPDLSLGEDKQTDAFIGSGWGGFYFSTIGIMLASLVDDLYVKTALMRIPFALLGAGSIALLALIGMTSFRMRENRLVFLVSFLFFELLSVSLVLHLREVRYYSVSIFLTTSLIYFYIRHRIAGTLSCNVYITISIPLLFLLFNTFIPGYMAFLLFIVFDCIFTTLRIMVAFPTIPLVSDKRALQKSACKPLLVVLISPITILPVAFFFRTREISRAVTDQFGFNVWIYFAHIVQIVTTLGRYEFLYAAVFIKILMLVWLFRIRNEHNKHDHFLIARLSNLLGLYAIAYLLIVSRIPSPVLFERYFIILQPVTAAMMVLDTMLIVRFLAHTNIQRWKAWLKVGILIPGFCLVSYSGIMKFPSLRGHWHELAHPYFGPVDYAIDFIKRNYQNPERLVIATNYEENAYMFYLGSKVTIGYVGKNLPMDMLIHPDIVIYRSGWGNHINEFRSLLHRGSYNIITFPVFDLMVNNIPEVYNAEIYHLFETQLTDNSRARLSIFTRRK